jgi:hypothetical protein
LYHEGSKPTKCHEDEAVAEVSFATESPSHRENAGPSAFDAAPRSGGAGNETRQMNDRPANEHVVHLAGCRA